MNSLFNQLLSLRQMEYLAVDRDLNILSASLGANRFADCPNQVRPGMPVCLGFPELIGIEDLLLAIQEGRQTSFELKGIGRYSEPNHPLYIDLYVINNINPENTENQLIIFLEDVTEKMVLEQKLVQRANEISLLLEAWDSSNEYFNKVIQALADVLLVTNNSGMIKLINSATEKLFGYNDVELLGQPISRIILEYEKLLESSQQYLLVQEFIHDIEVNGVTKNGTQVALTFSCSAIQTNQENMPDLIYVGREISKR